MSCPRRPLTRSTRADAKHQSTVRRSSSVLSAVHTRTIEYRHHLPLLPATWATYWYSPPPGPIYGPAPPPNMIPYGGHQYPPPGPTPASPFYAFTQQRARPGVCSCTKVPFPAFSCWYQSTTAAAANPAAGQRRPIANKQRHESHDFTFDVHLQSTLQKTGLRRLSCQSSVLHVAKITLPNTCFHGCTLGVSTQPPRLGPSEHQRTFFV